MFYSQSLLSRKGPLGNIWMAAFCFKKLKREQIAGTDISSSIDKIMPEVQISYRVLAQLLLGIVKIFSKKVDYLYHDCNEALSNIRRSFIPIQQHKSRETDGAGLHNAVVTKGVRHAPNHNGTGTREAILAPPIEATYATYDQVTITVPQRFELDSFDLQIPEEGDVAKHDQGKFVLEDELTDERNEDERNRAYFLNEHYQAEMVVHTEFDFTCFTPVDDILPSCMMDIDFEISETYDSGSIGVRKEILKKDIFLLLECGDHENSEAKKSLGPSMHDEEAEHCVIPVELQEKVPSDLKNNIHVKEPENQVLRVKLPETVTADHEEPEALAEKHSEARTPLHDKSPGYASPKFMVTTPAKKEQLGRSRKRKNFFDEAIILSNETLRSGIHDASSLVCKRRKAPHTYLDTWRASKFTNLHQSFLDPLFPCTSLELKALFGNKSFDHSPRKQSEESVMEPVNVRNGIHDNSLHLEDSVKEITSADTAAPQSVSEAPIESILQESEVKGPSLKETPETVLELDLMDREFSSHEMEIVQDNGWSIRTRAVAKYLYRRFLDLRGREHKGIMSLARLLEGQTRRKCARFFYETLTLKGRGCIDVNQDSPYGEIIISSAPGLEAMFKDQ